MIPPDLHDQLTDRLRRRAADLFPGRPVAIAIDELPPANSPILATARPINAEPPPGYTLADRRPATRQIPLHTLLDQTLPNFGWAFRPTGVFHHVGSRPCATPTPEIVEEIWIDSTLTSPPPPSRLLLSAATVGPTGYLPAIGATTASAYPPLIAAPLALAFPWPTVLLLIGSLAILATILCVAAESTATRHFLDPDAREFVLDEVAGAAIAVCFVPADQIALGLVLAFATFRLFDVLKPGIQWIERRPWPGKVAWDDVIAGLYAGLTTAALTALL